MGKRRCSSKAGGFSLGSATATASDAAAASNPLCLRRRLPCVFLTLLRFLNPLRLPVALLSVNLLRRLFLRSPRSLHRQQQIRKRQYHPPQSVPLQSPPLAIAAPSIILHRQSPLRPIYYPAPALPPAHHLLSSCDRHHPLHIFCCPAQAPPPARLQLLPCPGTVPWATCYCATRHRHRPLCHLLLPCAGTTP